MRERYDWDTDTHWFKVIEDGVWSQATWAEIDAVAEVCFEFGVIVPMDYGCDESSTSGPDGVRAVFRDHFYYYDFNETIFAEDHSFSDYWSMLKSEFNHNRPVHYAIPGHAIVADGWNEEWIDDPEYGYQYYWLHINYGHGGNHDGWCPPQEIPTGGFSDEWFIRYILPEPVIGTLHGDYPLTSFGYRYFHLDLEGYDATFESGQYLQILKSGFLLSHMVGGEPVVFNGDPGLETVFYLEGDPDGKSRIRVKDGQVKMTNGAQVAIY
jgi:hypothetical protein